MHVEYGVFCRQDAKKCQSLHRLVDEKEQITALHEPVTSPNPTQLRYKNPV